jgi:predicted Mrr-cat superfamily restriction endonuclease
MKVFSDSQLPVYQVIGQTLLVHWDAKEVPAPSMGEPRTQWEQNEAVCDVADSYAQLVAKIITSVYDHNAEFAAINDGGEKYQAYQAFRVQAKSLAQGWVDQSGL